MVFTPDFAQRLHQLLSEVGMLVIWVVAGNTADYPGKFIARPMINDGRRVHAFNGHLEADSLEALRALLPPNLDGLAPTNHGRVFAEIWL